jgi:hypothetical protein
MHNGGVTGQLQPLQAPQLRCFTVHNNPNICGPAPSGLRCYDTTNTRLGEGPLWQHASAPLHVQHLCTSWFACFPSPSAGIICLTGHAPSVTPQTRVIPSLQLCYCAAASTGMPCWGGMPLPDPGTCNLTALLASDSSNCSRPVAITVPPAAMALAPLIAVLGSASPWSLDAAPVMAWQSSGANPCLWQRIGCGPGDNLQQLDLSGLLTPANAPAVLAAVANMTQLRVLTIKVVAGRRSWCGRT